MERIGVERNNIAAILYPHRDVNGNKKYVPKDDILFELLYNQFEVERLEQQMANRECEKEGLAPLYTLPTKSSEQRALDRLNEIRQAEIRELNQYIRKPKIDNINYRIHCMQNQEDVTLDEVFGIYKEIKELLDEAPELPIDDKYEVEFQEYSRKLVNGNLSTKNSINSSKKTKRNSPLKVLSNVLNKIKKKDSAVYSKELKVTTNDNFEKTLQKKEEKKPKKNCFKKVALASSIILGLIFPSKQVNKDEAKMSALKKIIATETRTNKNINTNTNHTTKEKDNNTPNKIVVNNKVVNKTLKKSIKIKNRITLRNATFHYSSTGTGPKVRQNDIPCDSYSIEKIAVLSHDNEFIDTIDINEKNQNMSIDALKENIKSVYGEDVKIKMNVTGIEEGQETYPNIGWTSINKVSGTAKVYSKKR